MVLLFFIPPCVALLAFYFLRSSKEMPKNWKEFVIELKIQSSGTQGLVEDTIMRFKNKVGELTLRLDLNCTIKQHNLTFIFRSRKTFEQSRCDDRWQPWNWTLCAREASEMRHDRHAWCKKP